MPVYSISSRHGVEANMNIISYVTPVSMQPKRMLCCIYKGTKTLELVEKNPVFILQLLDDAQHNLVRLLGKQSGFNTNKMHLLRKRNLLEEWQGFPVLKQALAVLELKAINRFDGGDHIGFICDVLSYRNIREGQPLTLNRLKALQIIRS
jgi:flavin reductase (DIM6/NTAB) family NADH-FMN oxidoreductase RutF